MCFFANGVELLTTHDVLKFKIPGAARHFDFQPFGKAWPNFQFLGELIHVDSGSLFLLSCNYIPMLQAREVIMEQILMEEPKVIIG